MWVSRPSLRLKTACAANACGHVADIDRHARGHWLVCAALQAYRRKWRVADRPRRRGPVFMHCMHMWSACSTPCWCDCLQRLCPAGTCAETSKDSEYEPLGQVLRVVLICGTVLVVFSVEGSPGCCQRCQIAVECADSAECCQKLALFI